MTRLSASHVTLAAAIRRGFLFDKEGTGTGADTKDTFAALREEFSRLHSEATTVVDAAAKDNRELTEGEKKANEQRFARMQTIKSIMDERAKFARLALEGDTDKGTVQTPKDTPGREEFEKSTGGNIQVIDKANRAEFAKALNRWALTGEMDRKFATITTATASGALLPRIIDEPVIPTTVNVFREAMAIYGVQPIVTGTTAELTVPVMGTSAGGVVAEDASAETENAPSLSESIVLNVSTYQSGSAWFSNQQLAATDFDLVSYIQTDLTYAKELGLEDAAIDAIIADVGITQSVATATTSGFTYENLVDLNNKLPKRFQRMKVIILSAQAFAAAEKLEGEDGHPILNRDPQNQSLARFNGTPVLRSDYLEAFGTSKVVGICVSLLGFRLRDVTQQNLARYTQVPTKPNQTGFNLFAYHAYGYAPSAVATLKTPAS